VPDAPWFLDALRGDETPDELRARGATQVETITRRLQPDSERVEPVDFISSRSAIAQWIDEERRGPENDTGTGWPTIDALLGKPLRHSEVVLVAARTGVGKTWVLQAILENALDAKREEAGLLIQLEMPAFHMAERLVTHALSTSPGRARDRARIDLTVDEVLDKAPLLDRLGIVEQTLHAYQIPLAIDAMEAATGRRPGIVAVDYIGLLRGAGRSRYEIASEVSQQLKAISKRERILLLCAVQLSRDAGDGSKRPNLDDLRDSGVIEEASDRVLGLWRPTPIEDEDEPRIVAGVELGMIVLKNRFGPTGGEAKLSYDSSLRLVETDDDGIPW
jgi:replicative DNA helicase